LKEKEEKSADFTIQLEQKDNRINLLEKQMTDMRKQLVWIIRKMRSDNMDEQDERSDAFVEFGDEILGERNGMKSE
jgi:hypothetical protein